MPKPAARLHRNAISKVGKTPAERPPNLPQHAALPEPYARLLDLNIEEEDEAFEQIAEELKAGDADAAVQKLIEITQDESYYDYYMMYSDSRDYDRLERRNYTPSQAVRVLSYMGEAGRAAIEPFLPLLNTEDDYLREELPLYYGAMGEAAFEPLLRTLNETDSDLYLRSGAGDCLAEMGERHPELRGKIIEALEQALANETEDEELNGFLVCNLIDLNAIEAYPVIAQAYEEERIDEFIVGLADVQEHFKMPVTAMSLQEKRRAALSTFHPASGETLERPTLDHVSGEVDYAESVEEPYIAGPKPGRNDPCHCGSGKKYKKCHGS